MDVPTARRPRPPLRAGLTLAVGLLAVGSGLVLLGNNLPDGRPRPVGGDAPVNAGAADRANIDANNSPALAQNPRDAANLAMASRVDSPLYACKLHISRDAGATWEKVPIPFPAGEEAPARCWSPDLVFGPDGTLYMSFVTLKGAGNVPNALWLVTSRDGGGDLSLPVRVAGPLTFQARLAADPVREGRLYLVWLQAESTALFAFPGDGFPIVLARSDDRGATWLGPVEVTPSNPRRVVAPAVAVGPRGELYVSYLDVGNDVLDYNGAHEGRGGPPYGGPWALVLARSLDRGATWTHAEVDAGVVPTQRFVVFFPPTPSLAVDPAGRRVYLAFHDARLGDADVWMWASDDGGATFPPPRRVNDTLRGDGTDQYLPGIALAANGRLDVVYYDRRADRANVFNEVSLQSSSDGGRTFGRRLKLSARAFDSRVGWNEEREMPELGSRLAVVSNDRAALAVWADTRSGTRESIKQDLGRGAVAFPKSSPLRPLVLVAGWIVAVTGAMVLGAVALWILRRGRPASSLDASVHST